MADKRHSTQGEGKGWFMATLQRCIPCGARQGVQAKKNLAVSEKVVKAISKKNLPEGGFSISTLLLNRDPSRSFAKHYRQGSRIGAGGFGTVWNCKHILTDNDRAVKIVAKTQVKEDMEFVFTEVEILLTLDHPNIAKLYEYFEDQGQLFMVTELCNVGDFGKLHRMKQPMETLRPLLRDVVAGLGYCHAHGIVHRDLKFENCLIAEGRTRQIGKVIDFGLSAIKSISRQEENDERWLTEPLGTKYFAAPEVIDPKQKYGSKCDIWSSGVMIFIFFTNEHPFAEDASKIDTRTLFKAIRNGRYRDSLLKANKVPASAKELLAQMLNKDQTKRIDAERALNMEWLRPTDCKELEVSQVLNKSKTQALCKRLNSWSDTSRFDRVLLMLSGHQAKMSEVNELRAAFMALDKNADGQISREELTKGLNSVSGLKKGEMTLKADIFQWLDCNRNSKLDYSEWLCATLESEQIASQNTIKELFNYFDADGGGKISQQELAVVLKNEEEVRDVIQRHDSSRDGQLDFQEFQHIMMALAERRSSE
mmetsp:Transcript_89044/g.177151  ORF Transcript_89044/g.177151 Transcript_89044/m.177151 type:complete len:537 (-) Transcript_89044:171-1781(-)